ncbi:MBL fold metallo-hydrolase [Comamonas terrigena]|uniref:MBL fold metallo-hydrolase n=1 Tax=Comamonas terrigena TaxID=32013 RepID=UPI002449BA67|nr:MBL fold metallo-hydrolase [Comamonas terrigena]MDH1701095.1 MBL fold metallo-hydrolase [Comamonas terrigena]
MTAAPLLWPEITVLERGWLSANNYLFQASGPDGGAALVDTGYCLHADQTVALVQDSLGTRPLARILNTHLHSDHCGGNAALQVAYPDVQTWIPPGEAAAVRAWDEEKLSYRPTGQDCPRFRVEGLLQAGTEVMLGSHPWQVHAAPGHDPHSVILFEPERRLLISADALWEHGFGVVFPEIEGIHAFAEVGATLDLIEALQPAVVLPGHGALFTDVATALTEARRKLAGFVADPCKHARYAAKVLLKYKLLEWQQIATTDALQWVLATPYFRTLHTRYFAADTPEDWAQSLVHELERSGAAAVHDGVLHNR